MLTGLPEWLIAELAGGENAEENVCAACVIASNMLRIFLSTIVFTSSLKHGACWWLL